MKSNIDMRNVPFFRIRQKQVMKPVSGVIPLVSFLLELHPHPTTPSASAYTQFQEAVRVFDAGHITLA